MLVGIAKKGEEEKMMWWNIVSIIAGLAGAWGSGFLAGYGRGLRKARSVMEMVLAERSEDRGS